MLTFSNFSTLYLTGESSHWSSSLKQLNDASTEEGTSDKERDDPKSEPESDPRQDSVEELLDSYERRRLHRRGATRQSFRDVVRERGSLRQRRHRLPSEAAGSSLLGQDEDEASLAIRHMALCHEDTSAGAVHCFQDEFGESAFVFFVLHFSLIVFHLDSRIFF